MEQLYASALTELAEERRRGARLELKLELLGEQLGEQAA
jgi:hypothetical protein